MQYRRAAASRGVDWLAGGWRLFIRSPGLWVGLTIIVFAIFLLLSLIPLVGTLAAQLLFPALVGGLIHGARELDQGRDLEVLHLFQAFVDRALTTPMLILGVVPVALAIMLILLMFMMLGGALGTGAVTGSEELVFGVLAAGSVTLGVVGFLLGVLAAAALLYAIPLVMFGRAEPLPAIGASVQASLANILPLLVLGVLHFMLAVLASIPLGLGWLVLFPVTTGVMYTTYKEIYGEDVEAPGGSLAPRK